MRKIQLITIAFFGLLLAGCGGGGSAAPGDTDIDAGGNDTASDTSCGEDADCDDSNPCTDDTCDEGVCSNADNAADCDDGNECTTGDLCANGECSGSTLDCSDENVCTDDSCQPDAGCVYANNDDDCDDGNACTLDDGCVNGLCQGGGPLICNDENECTDDDCEADAGCVFTNNDAGCDDGEYCSVDDHCANGVCVGDSEMDCDDQDPCTEDSCDDEFGCQNAFNTAPCDDDDPCTVGDICALGDCQPGSGTLDCGDSNICTDDSCLAGVGCQYGFNTAPCDDSNACTMNDTCYVGNCLGVPLDADQDGFVSDLCDGGVDCNDGDAGINPLVFEGPRNTPICLDSADNDCDGLTDAADNTCQACTAPIDCADSDVCNGTEGCDAGTGDCLPGTNLDCDDDNDCTNNPCDPTDGCGTVNNTAICDDNDLCTLGDICGGGDCQPGTTPETCEDFEICTDDSCVPDAGCVFEDNTLDCDAGVACTEGDACQGGSCVAGPIRDQDEDGYPDGTGACTGNDCDDGNADVHPGAEELCDGHDNNCNWLEDEGCPECTTVDPDAEMRIDNDYPYSGYGLAANDEALALFAIDSEAYNIIEVTVAFYDFCANADPDDLEDDCVNPTGNGEFSLHIYEYNEDDGLLGPELASGGPFLVSTTWDSTDEEFFTFPLDEQLPLKQGQVVWVGVRSEDDQTENGFLPLFDLGILLPYFGGALLDAAADEYYSTWGNWLIRVQGCAEGPWIALADHDESPPVVAAGGSTSSNASLINREFGDSGDVIGTFYCDDEAVSVDDDTSSFGVIAASATETGAPDYSLTAADGAFGVYTVYQEASDGANNWYDGWPVYVQGTGCSMENHQLLVDSETSAGYMGMLADDLTGNWFIVDSTAFSLTSIDAEFYSDGQNDFDYHVYIYTYRAGYPDKVIRTLANENVSGNGQFTHVFDVDPPLTFHQGDSFWVLLQPTQDMTGETFGPSVDTGDTDTGSVMMGVIYDSAEGGWFPWGRSVLLRANGCQATELVYDSHVSSPEPPSKGASATLDITIRNEGAIDAIDVQGTLTSTFAGEVDVTQDERSFGDVTAGATATATGFVIDVAADAPEFQYVLDLELTAGGNTWNEQVPVQLEGGEINLVIDSFSATLVGDDIRYNFDVTNSGNIDCLIPFDIDLYYDPNGAPSPGDPGDWTSTRSSLAAGATATYQTTYDNVVASEYNSYLQIDTGEAVTETNETDNLDGPETISVGATDIFALLDPARKWFDGDMPVEYRFVDGDSQPDMSNGDEFTAVNLGFDHWEAVDTATITFAQIGNGSSEGYVNDGYNTISFGDADEVLGTGTLAAALPIYSGQTTQTNGTTFRRLTDADIVFNDDVSGFCTNAEAGQGGCLNRFDIEGVATHEIGHCIGLDHPEVYEATMYYAVSPCDDTKATLEQSDINGVTFIYPQ